ISLLNQLRTIIRIGRLIVNHHHRVMSPTSYQTAPSRINRSFAAQHQPIFWIHKLVRRGGLEPPRPKALPPQGSVSTNSTTTAAVTHSSRITGKKKGLIQIIRFLGVQLVKFQPVVPEQLEPIAPRTNCKHRLFVSWRKSPR